MADRFDPAVPLESTPPFLRWTLVRSCPLRELEDCFDPDRTERLLRGVRCYSDALAEGRVHDGIVVQRSPPSAGHTLGFDVQAVLEPLGGESLICQCCERCPANALQRIEPTALAGCVGYLVPPEGDAALWLALALMERPGREDLLAQRRLLTQSVQQSDQFVGFSDYLAAIEAALEHELPLVLRAYPGGRCEGRRWYVEAHCGRCKRAWPEPKRQQCGVCGQLGGRQAERRRMRIGTRPYRRLRDFAG